MNQSTRLRSPKGSGIKNLKGKPRMGRPKGSLSSEFQEEAALLGEGKVILITGSKAAEAIKSFCLRNMGLYISVKYVKTDKIFGQSIYELRRKDLIGRV